MCEWVLFATFTYRKKMLYVQCAVFSTSSERNPEKREIINGFVPIFWHINYEAFSLFSVLQSLFSLLPPSVILQFLFSGFSSISFFFCFQLLFILLFFCNNNFCRGKFAWFLFSSFVHCSFNVGNYFHYESQHEWLFSAQTQIHKITWSCILYGWFAFSHTHSFICIH